MAYCEQVYCKQTQAAAASRSSSGGGGGSSRKHDEHQLRRVLHQLRQALENIQQPLAAHICAALAAGSGEGVGVSEVLAC